MLKITNKFENEKQPICIKLSVRTSAIGIKPFKAFCFIVYTYMYICMLHHPKFTFPIKNNKYFSSSWMDSSKQHFSVQIGKRSLLAAHMGMKSPLSVLMGMSSHQSVLLGIRSPLPVFMERRYVTLASWHGNDDTPAISHLNDVSPVILHGNKVTPASSHGNKVTNCLFSWESVYIWKCSCEWGLSCHLTWEWGLYCHLTWEWGHQRKVSLLSQLGASISTYLWFHMLYLFPAQGLWAITRENKSTRDLFTASLPACYTAMLQPCCNLVTSKCGER